MPIESFYEDVAIDTLEDVANLEALFEEDPVWSQTIDQYCVRRQGDNQQIRGEASEKGMMPALNQFDL